VISLATGIAVREGCLLLVASRYKNHPQPLWNLPGGRQLPGELLVDTVVREFYEETHLRVHAGALAYVSESYDGQEHFLNATFEVEVSGGSSIDDAIDPQDAHEARDHLAAVEWVPLGAVRERIAVAIVREPLLAYLTGVLERRYAGFARAGITIEWPDDSA
jgi:ADP-ribose pyrophosphatase YjhB (NUDIX family)